MNETLKFSDYISKFNKVRKLFKKAKENLNMKIYILRTFNCESINPILTCELYNSNINGEIKLNQFEQSFQDVLNDSSEIYSFNPDIIIFVARIEDFYSIIIDNYFNELNNLDYHKIQIIDNIKIVINNLLSKTNAYILINNFFKPYSSPIGILQSQGLKGLNNFFREINILMAKEFENSNKVFIIDNAELISNLGIKNIIDLKMLDICKNPYKFEYYVDICKLYVKFIKAIKEIRKKCIILDLDDTLWKGNTEENEFKNICIYSEFQKQLLYLNKSKIILAISSKANKNKSLNIIRNHPDMILKENNFSSIKINYHDTLSNIKEIVSELNIKNKDSLFISGSKVECNFIRNSIPDIEVFNLPKDKYEFVEELKKFDLDFIKLT